MYEHLFFPVKGSEISHLAIDGSIKLAVRLGVHISGLVVETELPVTVAT